MYKPFTLKRLVAVVGVLSVFLTVFAGISAYQLSNEIRSKFDGQKWPLPAVVYARPLELYPGMSLIPDIFQHELKLAGYREEDEVLAAGGYARKGSTFDVITRDFMYSSGYEKSASITVLIRDSRIVKILKKDSLEEVSFVRIDPAKIGSFHPLIHEDRLVLQQWQVPELLQKSLIAVEDKNFLNHHGISVRGIGRALWANVRAGRTVQGGSTLTQQLVKNFFLNSERTFSRKLREAVMAILLEFHYSKEEILAAYVNEVFLGQDGSRAIHGFGLASQFYFKRSVDDLSVAQTATLVGMIQGPSLYDPRRNQEKCLGRRNAVLDILLAGSVIDKNTYDAARMQPLTDLSAQSNEFNRFPAFLDLVKRQLSKEYQEEDLKGSGLHILTTLDPSVQQKAGKIFSESLTLFEKKGKHAEIEGAMVITSRETGEIQAVVGGRNPRKSGFNRALDAKRAIGSLVKPAVYLTALAGGYTLATPLDDTAVTLENQGTPWRPQNYDKQQHGRVGLYTALAKSYNLATVRLGMELGISEIIKTLGALGYSESIQQYPSLFLGAVSMSPLQVTQLYQTIASGGFYLPLRSIQAVLSRDGELLTRYGLQVEQRFAPDVMFLLNHGLQRVMTEGSGSALGSGKNLSFAGKTGTTDDLRDSWFAGFSGDRLAVVWLGNDDNHSISLSGSSGALVVWGKIMAALDAKILELPEPPGIVWRRINRITLKPATIFNRDSTVLPFIAD